MPSPVNLRNVSAVFIRKSRAEKGQVIIPPGGLVYLEDTQGGEVALRGKHIPVLSHLPTYKGAL